MIKPQVKIEGNLRLQK